MFCQMWKDRMNCDMKPVDKRTLLVISLSWRHQEVLDRYHHDAIRRGNRAKSAVPDHETPTIPQRHRITLENKTKNRPTEC